MARFLIWGGFALTALGIGSCAIGMLASLASAGTREQAGASTDDLIGLVSGGGYMFVGGILSVVIGSILKAFDVDGKLRTASLKRCPFCAEKIHRNAVKCRFCGEVLSD